MAPTLQDHDQLVVDRFPYEFGKPHDGDIVTLHCPIAPDRILVKRVIAEAGEAVKIVAGVVYVNGDRLPDDYVDRRFRSHEDRSFEPIAAGYYFVMGDHRNDSSDSRDFGLVPEQDIIGKVTFRWWPFRRIALF